MDSLAGESVEHRQVFWSAQYMAGAVAIVLVVFVTLDGGVCSCLIDIITQGILRTCGCLAHQFCLAVFIKIVHHKLRIVCTGPDVLSQIDSP